MGLHAAYSKLLNTRMHSSRMRTTCSSSCLLWGWVCLSACWDTPQVWASRPPLGVCLETPSGCGPGEIPWVWAWRPPWVWAWRPPKVWAWKPLQARPLNFPLGCGPGDLQGMLGYPPLIPARRAGIPPAMHAGIPPPPLWTEFLTHASENITLAQTSFTGGENNCNSGL